jgi:ubiquinone/menaquinone biosynthesis C-methylase UbiE
MTTPLNQSRSWYEQHVLPYLLDFACGLSPIQKQRRKVIPSAAGRVLEIGIGTGLNLPFYDQTQVQSLVGVDPAEHMHALAQRRSQRCGLPVELIQLSAEQLPIDSASFDCVVCTYTLCSIDDPLAALREMRRVLKPKGRLLFAEHGLAPDASVARWQFRLEPYWSKLAGGCRLTRHVPELLRDAGFHATGGEAYVAWPKTLGYNYWGVATVL